MKSAFFVLAILIGFGGLTGCSQSSSLEPVTGKVRVEGKPARGAMVMFHTDGPANIRSTPATATVGDDGSFTMATGVLGGVKPGRYLATVVWPDPNVKLTDAQRMMGASLSDAPDLLKGRYATRETSGLAVEIKPGINVLEPFDLK